MGPAFSEEAIAVLRGAFAPEVVVPPSFTVRPPRQRELAPQLTPYLLDYDQEWLLKMERALDREAMGSARDFGVRLINGVAGSGKSLILVYRAHLLRALYRHKRILALTHNRPLIRNLEARYQRLAGSGAPVEWRTFQAW